MKSKLLILIITSFFSLHTYSQIVWAPQSAKWTYNGQGQTISYIEIKYVKDTLLLEKQSKVLEKTEYAYRSQTNDIVAIHLGNEITYEEDSVVYLYTYNQFDTLFSFKSTKGDTWKLNCHPNSGICQKNGIITVQDTGTMVINNTPLKYLALTYNYDSILGDEPYIVEDTVIERIGSTSLYFLPWDIINSMLDGNEGGNLRCYDDNELGSYSNNFDKSCNFLVSLENTIETKTYKVYPVPCSGVLNIDFKIPVERHIVVKDLSGKEMIFLKSNGLNCSIDLAVIPNGIFLLSIIGTDGTYCEKILKN